MILKPNTDEYPEFYQEYLTILPDSNIITYLKKQKNEVLSLFESLSESQLKYRYSEGKWSTKEIMRHLIDTEQIFAYRALCISRNESTSLPGFNQNSYITNSNINHLTKNDLIREFELLRSYSIQMFSNFDESYWNRKGKANGYVIVARVIPWIIAGHTKHHLTVLREKYLKI